MKELYQKRVSDVRFLIPVLNGLDKQQVISVLPKLITQSPNVVKEVFNRLLGSFQRKCFTSMFAYGRVSVLKLIFWIPLTLTVRSSGSRSPWLYKYPFRNLPSIAISELDALLSKSCEKRFFFPQAIFIFCSVKKWAH